MITTIHVSDFYDGTLLGTRNLLMRQPLIR